MNTFKAGEQHAVLLPGHISGYNRDNLKLLPSSDSKMDNNKALVLITIDLCKLVYKLLTSPNHI